MSKLFIFSFIKNIWPYIKCYQSRLWISFISIIVTSSIIIFLGYGLKTFIDENLISSDNSSLTDEIFIIIFLSFLLAIFSFIRIVNTSYLSEVVTANLRAKLFSHLINLNQVFFERERVGTLISYLYSNMVAIHTSIRTSIVVSIRNFLQITGSVFLMIRSSSKLASFSFLTLSLIFFLTFYLGKKVRFFSSREKNRQEKIESLSEEVFSSITTIQSTGSLDYFLGKYKLILKSNFDLARKRILNHSLMISSIVGLSFSSFSIILWFGGHEVQNRSMSVGELSTFIFYAMIITGSINSLGDVISEINRAGLALEQIVDILEIKSESLTQSLALSPRSNGKVIQNIHLENLTFCYPTRPDQFVLRNLSILIKKGEKVMITGPSGSGKSTIFKLLLRFYEVKSGSIFFFGVDIKKIKIEALQSFCALVPQSPVLFNASMRENLTLGKFFKEKSIQEACEHVFLWNFINTLPYRLNTLLGEKGSCLSSGQKQRVAIARSILLNSPIFLMDEVTSALDKDGEHEINQSLIKILNGKTVLTITHKPEALLKIDRAIHLDKIS